jgi:hypothetical protein
MEFIKIHKGVDFYWTLRDTPFLPYEWLTQKDVKSLPRPFILYEIHPDCPVGFESGLKSDHTNIIELPHAFEKLHMSAELRKDLRRIEKKNSDIVIRENEKDALDRSGKWFLEMWQEDREEFKY